MIDDLSKTTVERAIESGVLAQNFLQKSVTVLDHDTLITLPSTWVTLVPAPGENQLLLIFGLHFYARLLVAYTNFGVNLALWPMTLDQLPGDVTLSLLGGDEGLPPPAILHYQMVPPPPNAALFGYLSQTPGVLPLDGRVNLPLQLRLLNQTEEYASQGNLTGGDPANSLTVTVLYGVITLS